jgi:hypothetical protein
MQYAYNDASLSWVVSSCLGHHGFTASPGHEELHVRKVVFHSSREEKQLCRWPVAAGIIRLETAAFFLLFPLYFQLASVSRILVYL